MMKEMAKNIKIGKMIGIISRFSMLHFNRELKSLDLNGQQMKMLLFIYKNEGISQDQIVSHVLLNKGTVGRHLQKLEDKKLVRRKTSTRDHRINQLFLSDKAREYIPFFNERMNEWQTVISRGMSDTELDQLETVLKKITHNIFNEFDMTEKCKELI